jgi:hypothetical protein
MTIKSRVKRLTGIRTLAGAVGALATLATLVTSSPALAKEPTGAYKVFADCPLKTPNLAQCIYATTTSGKFIIGKTEVPIEKTITLQGGIVGGTEEFVGAADGNTLSKTALNVPGGLLNLIKCKELTNPIARVLCESIFERGLTGVTATAELAGKIVVNQANLVTSEGVALTLPVKVKLDNPLLGNACYIGSNAHPVTLNLTTGTTSPPGPNKPISGSPGSINTIEEGGILVDSGLSLVDNAFAAPATEGCGGIFSFLIGPIVNAKVGLPAAAGHNTAVLTGELQSAGTEAVIESEK